MQTTFEPLLWLLSAETWLELSRASGGGAVTDVAPRDCTTRGFFWSKKQTNGLLLTVCNLQKDASYELLKACFNSFTATHEVLCSTYSSLQKQACSPSPPLTLLLFIKIISAITPKTERGSGPTLDRLQLL